MTKLIILDTIRDLNAKIEREVEYYEAQLAKTEFRLSVLEQERKQLLELLQILEGEKNK